MSTGRHNFDLGDIITVFNRTLGYSGHGGKFITEGRAAIVRIKEGEDMYGVRFLDDKPNAKVYTRYVDPNGQENAKAYVEFLNASIGAQETR